MRRVASALLGFILLAAAAIIFLSLSSYDSKDLSFLSSPFNQSSNNLIGISGAYLAFILLFIAGYSSYFIPFFLFFLGLDRLNIIRFRGIAKGRIVKVISFLFLTVAVCSLAGIFFSTKEGIYLHSGIIGFYSSLVLTRYLGFWGAFIFLAITVVTLFWMLAGFFFVDLFALIKNIRLKFIDSLTKFPQEKKEREQRIPLRLKTEPKIINKVKEAIRLKEKDVKPEIRLYTPKPVAKGKKEDALVSINAKDKSYEDIPAAVPYNAENFRLPSLDILKVPPAADPHQLTENIEANIKNLEEALADFGVGAKVVSVQKGPVVTMYELTPRSGVKIQHITTLSDDIALAMKASGVRIVAPIPGRGTVGIEIPNLKKHLVYLREVLEDDVFINSKSKLTLAIGKDVKGDPIVSDLGEMPHLLIAGTTGSGKTVCVNSIISSIMFKSKPNEVKFILIDPKKVELAPYGGIPHLLHPIISDAKKAFYALNWAVGEMETRYKLLASEGTRNIDAYNLKGLRMPYIIIIVDELADLMVVARDKIEMTIQRLAQLSRAVGIHLILATQRPSVDVITGVIKANFPARVSFKVSSRVDSRTVLDVMGAEKLLGKGDCLFIKPGLTKSIRAQSSFIDDEDIASLTQFLRSQGGPKYEEGIIEEQKKIGARLESDELLPEAIKVILISRQASASLLQRRLRVGYTRAARLLDLMEEQNVIGPFCGSKAREILVDPESYLKENKLI